MFDPFLLFTGDEGKSGLASQSRKNFETEDGQCS